jgi:hypothetical protein
MRELEGKLERKVVKMLRNGAEADQVAQMLVKNGWDLDDAQATAELEDGRFQDQMRDNNMLETHRPRSNAVWAGGGLATIAFLFYLIRFLARFLD